MNHLFREFSGNQYTNESFKKNVQNMSVFEDDNNACIHVTQRSTVTTKDTKPQTNSQSVDERCG